ncbi:MAG: 16S rRNA (cytidine(1402)-2'-O)-methyltransferase [Patescibacteria group bacterium]|nr:16S rRNA (cytidine(1402)-2'-O)-methyltransferase [Patescibacteria group bacterium]
MSNLYVVALPIGNLEDITLRGLKVLRNSDLILSEDTRVTMKLLNRYDIKVPLLSYHQHSKLKQTDYILNLLEKGKNMALVCDAGTPGISDPGSNLIKAVITRFGSDVKIIPIPGPSALIAIASISAFPMNRFLFLGFPPLKRKRKKFFEEIACSKYPVIFYESPRKILKTLKELEAVLNSEFAETRSLRDLRKLSREIIVGRELTKKFETIYRGDINKVIEELEKNKIKGEFVVIINNSKFKS